MATKMPKNQVVPDINLSDLTDVEQRSSLSLIDNYLQAIKNTFSSLINPQAELKTGRATQLITLTFFGVVTFVGVMVQVYTESQMVSEREHKFQQFQYNDQLGNGMFDLIALIGREMEVAYENNNVTYENFLLKCQDAMREVDTYLMWISVWPTAEAIAVIRHDIRDSVSSATALRAAIRTQRDARKAAVNGVTEMSILTFYVTLIDQLSALGRGFIMDMPRFPGWGDFMTITAAFQTWMNFKKYATVAKKIIAENRTLSTSDPIVQMLNLYYSKYVEYVRIGGMVSTFGQEKINNITSLDVTKNVEHMHDELFNEGASKLSEREFTDQAKKHAQNLEWYFDILRARVHDSLSVATGSWPIADVFSAPILAASLALSLITVVVHIVATRKTQRQVVTYRDNVRDLSETLIFLYDYIPKNFLDKARSGTKMPIQRFEDICIMVMDICNIEELTADLKLESFVAVMEDTYLAIEKMLRKYSCFKLDMGGSYFVLGSGAGGYHHLDHVLELVLVALELQDAVAEMSNVDKEDDYDVRLRIGLHVGPCFGRIVHLRLPRMVFVGTTTHLAALVHATSLPVSVQVSEAVFNRLAALSEELDFYRRGRLIVGAESLGNLYWVRWADEFEEAVNQEDPLSDVASVT